MAIIALPSSSSILSDGRRKVSAKLQNRYSAVTSREIREGGHREMKSKVIYVFAESMEIWTEPSKVQLFRDPAGQDAHIRRRIAARGIVAGAAHLEVCLLHKRRPEQARISTVQDMHRPAGSARRQQVVDDNSAEAAVEVEPHHVFAILRKRRTLRGVIVGVEKSAQHLCKNGPFSAKK